MADNFDFISFLKMENFRHFTIELFAFYSKIAKNYLQKVSI